ncbi:MAG: ASCH domain-containing protein [Actinomycetota bacterium]|nr:ASCH domain-containing protein [Actinomycetota bacterium]
MRPPLPPVDRDQVEAFWQRCRAAGAVAPDAAVPEVVGAFGDHVEMADSLLALVVQGRKRATAGALADFAHDGEPLPQIGSCWIATDGAGRPRAMLRCTDVRIGPLSSVDDSFAWDEGENDRTRAGWLGRTRTISVGTYQRSASGFIPTSKVFERFAVDYHE